MDESETTDSETNDKEESHKETTNLKDDFEETLVTIESLAAKFPTSDNNKNLDKPGQKETVTSEKDVPSIQKQIVTLNLKGKIISQEGLELKDKILKIKSELSGILEQLG